MKFTSLAQRSPAVLGHGVFTRNHVRGDRQRIPARNGKQSTSKWQTPMSGIRDERQLIDKRLRVYSLASVKRNRKPPWPKVVADMDLVRLIAGDGGPGGELPDGFTSP
jgi:hypothetical protein